MSPDSASPPSPVTMASNGQKINEHLKKAEEGTAADTEQSQQKMDILYSVDERPPFVLLITLAFQVWMDGWMDGWVGGWVGGWVSGGWMDE